MNLAEVLVAALILVGASGASLQIWAASAAQEQRWANSSVALQASEADRLLLQRSWRSQLAGGLNCQQAAAAMAELAAQQPAAEGLERQIELAGDGQTLQVAWPALQRQRWISPAALGVCSGPQAQAVTP